MNKIEITASFHKSNTFHPFLIAVWGEGHSSHFHLTQEQFLSFLESTKEALLEANSNVFTEKE